MYNICIYIYIYIYNICVYIMTILPNNTDDGRLLVNV